MTSPPLSPPPVGAGVRPVTLTVVRLLLSTALLLAIYYLVPVQRAPDRSDLPFLLLDVVLFAGIVVVQVPVILRSRHPVLRSVESMVTTVLVYLVLFARIYLSAVAEDPAAFNRDLSHHAALYFTVTVFATVGFGDIVAANDGTRLLVTVQMLLNLAVLGGVIRLLLSTGSREVARRNRAKPPSGTGRRA